jgi:predicted permease
MRSTIKSIFHTPLFAGGAVLTFALGIGVNVAVFSAVDRVLFRPLPYANPERLVVMTQYRAGGTEPDLQIQAPYVVRARQAPGVEELTVSTLGRFSFRFTEDPDGARYYDFVRMAFTALKTLGVRPILGSDFTEEDARQQRRRVLISYATWQRAFGGRLDIVGQPVWGSTVGRHEIAGVLPDGFFPPQLRSTGPSSGIALTWQIFEATPTINIFTSPFIRLKSGVSMAQAQAQIDTVAADLGPSFPARPGVPASVVRLRPLREALFGRYTTYVALVYAAATMVLMVACANLASLFLVRGRSREHRAAIQVALGASSRRLIQEALAESLVLAVAGCVIALIVLGLTQDAMLRWLPPTFSSYVAPVFEARVLMVSLALATASAMIAGLLPGWRASHVDLLPVLQHGSNRVGSGRLRGGGALLAVEVTLATVLVLGAVMMGRTLLNLEALDVGFEPKHVFTVAANLPPSNDKGQLFRQYEELLSSIRGTPGVKSAAAADTLPMVDVLNRPMIRGRLGGQRVPTTEGLVETLGMRVVAGRTFSANEVRTLTSVGMLSLEGLRLVWPGMSAQQAVGQFLELPEEPPRQIIGVVSDVRSRYLAPTLPTLYVPIGEDGLNRIGVLFAVRVNPGRTVTAADVSRQFKARGLTTRSVTITAVADELRAAVADQTFRARLFAAFGLVSVILAVTGVYAVQSFTVAQRRTEFGIRVALGAAKSDLWRLLVVDSIRPTIVGVLLGLALSYWASQFVQSFLYGVTARDPQTFLGVALVLLGAGAVAVWVPARRASRTDPATVLRTQ